MVNHERIWIEPRLRDAARISRIFWRQGDGRGLVDNGTLILFDSYGHTHHSICVFFKIRPELSVIFRINGQVWVDCELPHQKCALEQVFSNEHCKLIREIYKHMGEYEPYATMID